MYTQSSSIFSPIPVSNQNTGTANFSYLQGFKTGTNMSVGFTNTHTTTDSPTATYSPTISSGLEFSADPTPAAGFRLCSQHAIYPDRQEQPRDFRYCVPAANHYHRGPDPEHLLGPGVRLRERAGAERVAGIRQKTLSDTQKQVEIGTLAPIEVVRAQSTVATDQQALTLAQTNLQLQQLLMKNALSRTLVDPQAGGCGSDSNFHHAIARNRSPWFRRRTW